MSGWSDVVTTALLGTDRRPLPTDLPTSWGTVAATGGAVRDPASTVLDLAAAHRALTRSSPQLATCPAPDTGPEERLPRAPEAAQALLGALLEKPQPGMLNCWLAAADNAGLAAGVEHWPRLAVVALRIGAVDRVLLRRVVGPRGEWFYRQHPQWVRLVPELMLAADRQAPGLPGVDTERSPERQEQPMATALAAASVGRAPASAGPSIDDLPPEAAIELILAGPDPLTPELVRAALDLVGSGALGSNTRAVAVLLAQRIPLPLTAEVSERQEHHVYGPGRGTISAVLLARDGFAVMEQVLQARLDIAAAFEPVAESGPDVGAARTAPGSAPEAPGKMKP